MPSDWVIGAGRQSGGVRLSTGTGSLSKVRRRDHHHGNVAAGSWSTQRPDHQAAPPPPVRPARPIGLIGTEVSSPPAPAPSAAISISPAPAPSNSIWPATALLAFVGPLQPALDRVKIDSNKFSRCRTGHHPNRPAPPRQRLRPNHPHNTALTNFDTHGKPARVTLHCNQEERSLAVLVDGVEVKRWTDLGGFSDLGTGFVVQNQPTGATVKLSHFKVSKWAGQV